MIQIVVPMKIESKNKTKDWHWGKKAKNLKDWMNTLAILGRGQVGNQQFKNLTIIAQTKRLFDRDNLWGGSLKQAVDAVKKLGWIKDDNVKDVNLDVKQEKSKVVQTLVRLW